MAGTLKVDSINADSNLALKIANTAVAFIDSTGLKMSGSNLQFSGGGTLNVAANNAISTPTVIGANLITTSGTTALGIAANGQITTANAPFILTGGQLQFPATQIASGDGNCLDDYEEGTWTPVIQFGGGSTGMTFIDQTGNYTKIGNMVFAHGSVVFSNKGSSTGSATISLPFTSKSGPPYSGPRSGGYIGQHIYFSGVTNGVTFMVDHSSSVAGIYQGNNATNLTSSNFTNDTAMYGFCIVYQANA